jgi:hypothetical protein
MASNLELIGINERSGLITPNLYKQDWAVPSSLVDNYSVLHTRALSDITTPIYGKGTGIFLDTAHGGGDYDINGNINYIGSGRLNAIVINTAQWSYGPATPYSVTNTRALSDSTTPVYGKGTGLFLDTDNGGGEYDINGNQTNFPGSGRAPLMNYNLAIWTFGKAVGNNYAMSHPHALRPTAIPTAADILLAGDVHGKGTNSSTVLDFASEFVLAAHTDYKGGSWDDIISRDRNIYSYNNLYFVDITSPNTPTNWYTLSHPNSQRPLIIPTQSSTLLAGDNKGKGTNSPTTLDFVGEFVLAAHTDYKGGSWDDIISRDRNIYSYNNLYFVDVTNFSNQIDWYTKTHPNSRHPLIIPTAGDLLIAENGNGDVRGKGTGDSTILDFVGDYVLAAHTNYLGGSYDDIIARKRSISSVYGNLYWVSTNEYSATHPNALAGADERGKGTKDNTNLLFANDYVLAAHTNYLGGSSTDVINRNKNILDPQNTYWVDTLAPLSNKTNWYTMLHPNALAGIDVHGKGTNDDMAIDGTYAAHMNYKGGSNDDIVLGREYLNTINFAMTPSTGSHPFGYGYKANQDYETSKPICSNTANSINVGFKHW